MSQFCLLADPDGYAPSDIDLIADAEAREYWLKVFEDHFVTALDSAKAAYGRNFASHVASAEEQFSGEIARLREDPSGIDGKLGIFELCRIREKALRDNELDDPFRNIKQRENIAAMKMYPDVVDALWELPREARWARMIQGCLAGNIFDLGSPATMGYSEESVHFESALEKVPPRPWVVDDVDALLADLPASSEPLPWAKPVIFLDNAGADFVLGVLPLVRQMAACGSQVVLAANELPSLNDLTVEETIKLIEEAAALDEELAEYVSVGLLEVVSTGNDLPLIDLSEVSNELNEAAADADMVMLEGMGRSVESNQDTAFQVDSVQLCMLKDPRIAARVGGEVFDCVCRYRPVAR
jgi:type II pantothenate kinase